MPGEAQGGPKAEDGGSMGNGGFIVAFPGRHRHGIGGCEQFQRPLGNGPAAGAWRSEDLKCKSPVKEGWALDRLVCI